MENQETRDGVRDLKAESKRVLNGASQVEFTETKTTMLEEEEEEEKKGGDKTKHGCSRNDHDSTGAVVSSSQLVTAPTPAKKNERPPVDDVCPICFDDFVLPCITNCGHWFCGRCILLLWHYKPTLQLCNCPICFRLITKLSPEASLLRRQDRDVVKMLKRIQEYNHLAVCGREGLFSKIRALPLLIKRVFRDLMHPMTIDLIIHILRGTGALLGLLCWICNIGPEPIEWMLYFRQLGDQWAAAVIVIFCLVYIYRRLMRMIRVRRLAAVQLEHM